MSDLLAFESPRHRPSSILDGRVYPIVVVLVLVSAGPSSSEPARVQSQLTAGPDPLIKYEELYLDLTTTRRAVIEAEFAPAGIATDCRWSEPLTELDDDVAIEHVARAAVAETDPLIKAVLTWGAFGHIDRNRATHPEAIPLIVELFDYYSKAANDSFELGEDLAAFLSMACVQQGRDYDALALPILAQSDNPAALRLGYLFADPRFDSTRLTVGESLQSHLTSTGRFAAFECLRIRLCDEVEHRAWLTDTFGAALATESDDRNAELLGEGLVHLDGADALSELFEQIARAPRHRQFALLETYLVSLEPDQARIEIAELVGANSLHPAISLKAAGLFADQSTAVALVGLIRDNVLSSDLRIAALRGLWRGYMAPAGQALAEELAANDDTPVDLRGESLRLAFLGRLGSSRGPLELEPFLDVGQPRELQRMAVDLATYLPGAVESGWFERAHLKAAGTELAQSMDDLIARVDGWREQVTYAEPGLVVSEREAKRDWRFSEFAVSKGIWRSLALDSNPIGAIAAQRKANRLESLAMAIAVAMSPEAH
ncbi:hypothetical protein [Engelhardtia mirabilis]|uniref:Uncharacterized protein n=1 Tax=Engelhardtia mirabilis TaxID=2528011 RepID=A0A518BS93_9BACT|nr:hypothetical protein Pla133_49600 [Planctomycetes bacterium Pla133]QDV04163.1 hypothetical protein Pla86_49580 [Planctomycetes bacterium Pla86]